MRGASVRTRIRQAGKWVPFVVTMSPTMRCNLNCRGCYSGLYSKQGELSEAELDRLFTECKSMGNYFVVLTGGEPYLLKDSLLRLFRKHNDMYFLTFTNGTMLDEPLVDELARLGNVAPALSLEGFEAETDRRRGAGIHARVLRSMELLRSKGVLFGISVTYASDNVDVLTGRPVHRVHARARRPVRLVLHVHSGGQGPGPRTGSHARAAHPLRQARRRDAEEVRPVHGRLLE